MKLRFVHPNLELSQTTIFERVKVRLIDFEREGKKVEKKVDNKPPAQS